jgi:hypothetical protein
LAKRTRRVKGGTASVNDDEHSDGAPTIGDTGIRVANVAGAYEYSGYFARRDRGLLSGTDAGGHPHRHRLLLRPPRESDFEPPMSGENETPA